MDQLKSFNSPNSNEWISSLLSFFINIKSIDDNIETLRVALCSQHEFNPKQFFQYLDAKNKDFLLLDDFGAENMTPWLRDEVLGPIVNYRMNLKKPIFISSNINPKDLKSHFIVKSGDDENVKAGRISSRLISLMVDVSMDDGKKYNR